MLLLSSLHLASFEHKSTILISATNNLIAVTDDEQIFIVVLDVGNRSFYPKFRGFEKVYDAENDYYDEHEVEALDFTPDESMLVYTNMFTSEVVFADVKTGERKRYIEGTNRSIWLNLQICLIKRKYKENS